MRILIDFDFNSFFTQFLLAKVSAYRFRKSIFYAAKKLTIIEDFCVNFRSMKIFQYDEIIKIKFSSKFFFIVIIS